MYRINILIFFFLLFSRVDATEKYGYVKDDNERVQYVFIDEHNKMYVKFNNKKVKVVRYITIPTGKKRPNRSKNQYVMHVTDKHSLQLFGTEELLATLEHPLEKQKIKKK